MMKKLTAVVLLLVSSAFTLEAAAQLKEPMEKVVHVPDIPWHALSPTTRIRAVTGDMALMGFVEFEAGSKFPIHKHPNEQFSYVVEGRLKIVVDGRAYILGPGDIMVIPSFMPHGGEALEATKVIEAFGPTRADFQSFAK